MFDEGSVFLSVELASEMAFGLNHNLRKNVDVLASCKTRIAGPHPSFVTTSQQSTLQASIYEMENETHVRSPGSCLRLPAVLTEAFGENYWCGDIAGKCLADKVVVG